jgi:hypothetical protein
MTHRTPTPVSPHGRSVVVQVPIELGGVGLLSYQWPPHREPLVRPELQQKRAALKHRLVSSGHARIAESAVRGREHRGSPAPSGHVVVGRVGDLTCVGDEHPVDTVPSAVVEEYESEQPEEVRLKRPRDAVGVCSQRQRLNLQDKGKCSSLRGILDNTHSWY